MTPIEIARLEEARLAAAMGEIAPESVDWGGGAMCYAGPGSWANAVYGAGMSGGVSDADITAMVGFYQERGVPAKVELCSYADSSLTAGLSKAGFRLQEFETVLYRDLTSSIGPVSEIPAQVELMRLSSDDPERVRAFAVLAHEAFEGSGTGIPEPEWEIRQRVARQAGMVMITAWSGEELIGVASMEVAGQIATLFGAGVVEQHRGRGIHRTMLLERLRIAREAGAEMAVIGSLPGDTTERNALRLGFRMAYQKAVVGLPAAEPTA